MEYLRTNHDFWNGIAQKWRPDGDAINNVVGWYDAHNAWEDYNTILFRDLPTHGKYAIEYGCGPGRNIIKFMTPEWGFERIDGVDISQVNIDNCWVNFERRADPYLFSKEPPVLYGNDGCHLSESPDAFYDIFFSVIALQHIQSHSARLTIFKEAFRVLTPGGSLTAQMGFGPGHPRSVDYFNDDKPHIDGDVRVENAEDLMKDLDSIGFTNFQYVTRDTVHDEHPNWIWFKARKPS